MDGIHCRIQQPSAGGGALTKHPNFKLLPETCGVAPKVRSLTPTSSNSFNRKKRVVGGRISYPGDIPGLALIKFKYYEMDDLTYLRGTGILINSNYVLTTTSNVMQSPLEGLVLHSINFNSYSSYESTFESNSYAIESVITPSDYDCLSTGLALIRLSKPNTAYANYVEMKLRPKEHCDRVYSAVFGKLGEEEFCASSTLPLSGTCAMGDQGAPLLKPSELVEEAKQYTVVGIASHFHGCGIQGLPTVYSNVTYFLPWILDNIRP